MSGYPSTQGTLRRIQKHHHFPTKISALYLKQHKCRRKMINRMRNIRGNSKNKMCDKGNLTQYLFLKLGFVTKLINEMVGRKTNKEQTFQLTSLAFAQFKPHKLQRCWLLATRLISTQNKCVVLLFRWVTKYMGFFLYDETMVHKWTKASA